MSKRRHGHFLTLHTAQNIGQPNVCSPLGIYGVGKVELVCLKSDTSIDVCLHSKCDGFLGDWVGGVVSFLKIETAQKDNLLPDDVSPVRPGWFRRACILSMT